MIKNDDELTNPNVVKAIGREVAPGRLHANTFTRANATGPGPHYHHIGLYAYRRAALEKFVGLPPSDNEKREKLEQLRALDAGMRIDVAVDAYVPSEYIPFEAAKIDVHRRVAAAREPGELRALREELEDRFGPLPGSVANLLDLQRARIALGEAGARNVEFRAGRLRVSPVELESDRVALLNEHLPEAIYQWRERTIAIPVPEEAGARLGALMALADGLGAAAAATEPAEAAS